MTNECQSADSSNLMNFYKFLLILHLKNRSPSKTLPIKPPLKQLKYIIYNMADKKKVLIVTQEMLPYLPDSPTAKVSRHLPEYLKTKGKMELRILMPRFGTINERRHRLHEVVRLSGINIIIDEDDYPLIIKVASLPKARMQVYFLDNEDFFKRKFIFNNKSGKFYKDNVERMVFFCKGVIETVKKFGWPPDIIHCHGWMTALTPLYIKKLYQDDPHFADAKVVYSVYDNGFNKNWDSNFLEKLKFDGFDAADIDELKDVDLSLLKNRGILMNGAHDFLMSGDTLVESNVTKVFQNSGHYPFFEEPEKFIKEIQKFIASP